MWTKAEHRGLVILERTDKTMARAISGVISIALALTTSGSETMIVPMAFMALGLWLVRGYVKWE